MKPIVREGLWGKYHITKYHITRTLTDLGGAVDVLDGENVSQAVQQHLGQGRNQLCGGDQDVHAPPPARHHKTVSQSHAFFTRMRASGRSSPGLDQQEGFDGGAEPAVRHRLHVSSNPEQQISLQRTEQSCGREQNAGQARPITAQRSAPGAWPSPPTLLL